MADDMGYGDTECYNPGSLVPTPHINRIAAEGVRFTDAHSGCALCTPTRYGIMTGRHHFRAQRKHALVMPYEGPAIEPDRLTIAEMLRRQGYTTGLIGKWHLGLRYHSRDGARGPYTENENHIDFRESLDGGPVDLGFDSFFGSAGCSSSDPPYAYIKNRHTVGIPDRISPDEWNVEPGVWPGLVASGWQIDDVDVTFTGKAVEFIDEHASDAEANPFFLYFCLNTPHVPWLAPEFIRGASAEGPCGDMNALVDWSVGQVREALEKNGILDNTLLIFTSDNGPQNTGTNGHRAAGPLRGKKNTPFEGGHREPFVARWPGTIEPGTISDEIVSLTDLMATFAELTGFDMPDEAAEDSFSFLPALFGTGPCEPRPAMVNDTGGRFGHFQTVSDFALRRGPWKLIIEAPTPERPEEVRHLYNLDSDLAEEHNLIDEQPELAEELERLLNRIKVCGSKYLAC
jgi:arylsulfatase A